MKYRAIVLDIDGTTIPNSRGSVPSETVIKAINAAKKVAKVCFSTARPLFYAKPVLDLLEPNGYCIVNDATQIYDPKEQKILETIYLEKGYRRKIIEIMGKYSPKVRLNDGLEEKDFDGSHLPDKITSICAPEIDREHADQLMLKLSQIQNISVHHILSHIPGKFWVTVTNPTATKLHGVILIAQKLEIRPEEFIGVGDGYMDYALLSACGLKVAMDNAVPELKAIADYIAPGVEQDGVATVIEKYILNQ
jgi:HAD superfamily hydrolase (TIGR01484 family)